MKQTFTNHPTFSGFFSTISGSSKTNNQISDNQIASPWALKNIMAYSAALFVAETRNYGNYSLLLN